jgi:hypothetical protein
MRKFLILTAVTLATACLALPAQAKHDRSHFDTPHGRLGPGSDGFGAKPNWQGGPTNHLPIWRWGYYQGNDPDPVIRSQMMRDPVYGPWH